ncbi:MAG: class I SAM-dependent methyltransferase [Gammaproteobacteria bacterium]
MHPINKNNRIYYASAKAYPNDYRGVKWSSEESQFLRFKVLCEVSNHIFKSNILDVGCGFGHLVDYLVKNQFEGSYKGIDIVDQMIMVAKKRHPSFHFETNDLDSIHPENHDYILASGIFTFSDWENMRIHIQQLFSFCRKGIAFNTLRLSNRLREEELFYADPLETLTFCKSITPHAILRQDYMLEDFTVYMHK